MLTLYLALIDEPSNKDKFKIIYKSYKYMMFAQAFKILHSVPLAEEAVQESLIKIAKNISKISSPNCSQTKSFVVILEAAM